MEKYLKLIIFLSILIINKAEEYPCSKESEQTSCQFENINVPDGVDDWTPSHDDPSIVRDVSFIDSVVPIFPSRFCEEMRGIRNISIDKTQTKEIKKDAFQQCTNLTYLSIQENLIDKLDPSTFETLKNLQILLLRSNKIKSLPIEIFQNLNALQILSVSHNMLTEFPPELVANNKNLHSIYLWSNDLPEIDVEEIIYNNPFIKEFSLDGNEISCTRMGEISDTFKIANIAIHAITEDGIVKRYYETDKTLDGFICRPDISWLTANVRKENTGEKIKVIEEKTDDVQQLLTSFHGVVKNALGERDDQELLEG